MTDSLRIESPIGPIWIEARGGALVSVTWSGRGDATSDTPVLTEAARQLQEYFAGTRTVFDLPLDPSGSDFQKQVYRAMSAIPFGNTRTYGDIAKELGVAAQPIGQACGSNPIPVIIPCHRVVASDGTLGGFSARGGVETKVALLKHEGAASLLL
ncbi:MAG: methylated-DNA--[protein]-cysteine S-methyltransferase [Alphaproteobacteria bacterium]